MAKSLNISVIVEEKDNTANSREFYLNYLKKYAKARYDANPRKEIERKKKAYQYKKECQRLAFILL